MTDKDHLTTSILSIKITTAATYRWLWLTWRGDNVQLHTMKQGLLHILYTYRVNPNERPTDVWEHTCSDVSLHINPQTKNSGTKISRGSQTEFKTTRTGTDMCMQPQPQISRWVRGDPDKCKLLIRPTKIELIILGLKWGWVWGYLWRSSGQSQKKSICAGEAFMVSVWNKLYMPPRVITWSVSNLTILSGLVDGWARRLGKIVPISLKTDYENWL